MGAGREIGRTGRKERSGLALTPEEFATDLMDQPLKVVCQLGGWKTHETLLECYQRPDEKQMRQALAGRRRTSGDAQ